MSLYDPKQVAYAIVRQPETQADRDEYLEVDTGEWVGNPSHATQFTTLLAALERAAALGIPRYFQSAILLDRRRGQSHPILLCGWGDIDRARAYGTRDPSLGVGPVEPLADDEMLMA